MTIKSYKDLEVWQYAIRLVDDIYDCTASFPKEEMFGLSSQLRRAAVSIASNIAEGSVRSRKEYAQFVSIARGSLAELETQLIVAYHRKYTTEQRYKDFTATTDSISRMLMRLLQSLQRQ